MPGRDDTYSVDLPVFATVEEAVAATGANASVVYVPPPFAADAIMEAAAAGLDLVVAITEGVPVARHDRGQALSRRQGDPSHRSQLPRRDHPGRVQDRDHARLYPRAGRVGVISRSGTLTYEAVYQLTLNGLGQTTAVGIGGDPVNGTNFVDMLRMFEEDPETEGVIMIGEIGGTAEEDAAEFVAGSMTKPVAGFIAGTTAPPGKRMGHAGAIVSGGKGTAAAKIEAMTRSRHRHGRDAERHGGGHGPCSRLRTWRRSAPTGSGSSNWAGWIGSVRYLNIPAG